MTTENETCPHCYTPLPRHVQGVGAVHSPESCRDVLRKMFESERDAKRRTAEQLLGNRETMPAMDAVTEEGDEEMAKFNGARVTAWRSRASHALQVEISVRATDCANIEVKEVTHQDVDTLVLKLEDDGKKKDASAPEAWLKSHPKAESLLYKYVVLLDGETILAVGSVQDVE